MYILKNRSLKFTVFNNAGREGRGAITILFSNLPYSRYFLCTYDSTTSMLFLTFHLALQDCVRTTIVSQTHLYASGPLLSQQTLSYLLIASGSLLFHGLSFMQLDLYCLNRLSFIYSLSQVWMY